MRALIQRVKLWWMGRTCQACHVSLVPNWGWHLNSRRHKAIHGDTHGVIHRVGSVEIKEDGNLWVTDWYVGRTPAPMAAMQVRTDLVGIDSLRIAGWSVPELSSRGLLARSDSAAKAA